MKLTKAQKTTLEELCYPSYVTEYKVYSRTENNDVLVERITNPNGTLFYEEIIVGTRGGMRTIKSRIIGPEIK